jgi:hypothetical protein
MRNPDAPRRRVFAARLLACAVLGLALLAMAATEALVAEAARDAGCIAAGGQVPGVALTIPVGSGSAGFRRAAPRTARRGRRPRDGRALTSL